MRHLWLITYEYREGLGKTGFRDLQEKFRAVGQAPGVIAHYVRLDRKGGFAVWEAPEDPESTFEYLLQFEPWTKGEVIPITTVEDAFPVIQRWAADDPPGRRVSGESAIFDREPDDPADANSGGVRNPV